MKVRVLDPTRVLAFNSYFVGGRYERYQNLVVLQGNTANLPFYLYNWSAGVKRNFGQTSYRLLVDGVERASVEVSLSAQSASFTLDLRDIAEGWHELDIVGAAGETCPQWAVYVQRGPVAAATPLAMPVVLGTYGLTNGGNFRHMIGTVPARFVPTTLPLPDRECPAFATALSRSSLIQTQLVPARPNDIYRPNVSVTGVLSTINNQSYFWQDLVRAKPRVSLLDGPRGQGTVMMATDLQVGRRFTYFCDPWRVGSISANGTVKTLAGYRHRTIPSNHGGEQVVDLVGDWSAIPPARRGFHELWGMAWDKRTLGLNQVALPINGEQPHDVGPKVFVADTQNNRICALTFSPVSHEVAPRVTEFLTGLNDPWDVICEDGVLYVSERKAHRINAYDASTGAFIRTVVSGAALSGVNFNRWVFRNAALDVIRREQVVGPEGMYFLDGWLYYASLAMAQVKRVNLATGVIEVVAEPHTDMNSNFVKISVSDGSFGPRGTVFVSTWSNSNFGFPHAYLPGGGARWDFMTGTERGLPLKGLAYSSASAVANGRMICAGSEEGLLMLSKSLATDSVLDMARYTRGATEYAERGMSLTHGPAGWGYYGLAVPWGISTDIDYYLQSQGHIRS